MLSKTFNLKCAVGMHARPASVLVTEASKFKSDIRIRYKDKEISAKTIIGVMVLGIESGESFDIFVEGEDQVEAMNRMEGFFETEIVNM